LDPVGVIHTDTDTDDDSGNRTAHITDTPSCKSKATLTSDVVTNQSRYERSASERPKVHSGQDEGRFNSTKLLADLGEWERRMRLREFYHEHDR
jgi:hypothetical protein